MQLKSISKNRTEIYGFSILWIMLFHAIAMLNISYAKFTVLKPINFLITYGNMGCEIFLICSGISLYFAAQKGSDWMNFEKKRVLRLMIPVWIIDGWFWLFVKTIAQGEGVWRFFSRMSLLDFWITGDQQIWFVSAILLFYLLFPFVCKWIYKVSEERKIFIRALVLFVVSAFLIFCFRQVHANLYYMVEIGLTRLPVFIIGVYMGHLVYENKSINKHWLIPACAVAVCGLLILRAGILHNIWRRYFYMIPAIMIMFLVVWFFDTVKVEWVHAPFVFLGKISLNLYLSHILIINLYKLLPIARSPRLLHYGGILIISILFAWLMDFPIRKLSARMLSNA